MQAATTDDVLVDAGVTTPDEAAAMEVDIEATATVQEQGGDDEPSATPSSEDAAPLAADSSAVVGE